MNFGSGDPTACFHTLPRKSLRLDGAVDLRTPHSQLSEVLPTLHATYRMNICCGLLSNLLALDCPPKADVVNACPLRCCDGKVAEALRGQSEVLGNWSMASKGISEPWLPDFSPSAAMREQFVPFCSAAMLYFLIIGAKQWDQSTRDWKLPTQWAKISLPSL